jgi:N-glycosylase/DNA lyase
MVEQLKVHHFSLQDTLECGQFFRYTKVMDTYFVQSSDRYFSLRQRGSCLFFEGVERDFLIHFFRLEEDWESILREIDRDPTIHQAIRSYHGLRLIRQDPWECLLSFLCSSAKSIPHIRCIIESLCRCSGKKILFGNTVSYGFPRPQSIQNDFQLGEVGAGFRTSFLVKANQSVDEKGLLYLKELPFKEARQTLMELPGVGRKIADCVLLYSLEFLEAFPIDTWMKKGVQHVYFGGKRAGEGVMEEFVANHFGPYAGVAQLYLFHFWRHHPRLISSGQRVMAN